VRFVFVAATAETRTESHRRDHPPQGESAERPLTNGGPGACRIHRIGAGPGRRAADTLAERGAHVHLTGSARRPHSCSTPQASTPAAQSPDAAAGAGGQSLTAARRADPADRVLATDISPLIQRYAADPAAAGITTLQTRQLDAEHLDVPPEAFAAGYEVFAVNPLQAARYRERHSISGAKKDKADAHTLADMVRTDSHQLRPVAGDTPAGRGDQGGGPGA
jgi:hypothetical protein